jgi:hypothetical protein
MLESMAFTALLSPSPSLLSAAERLAALLTGGGGGLADPGGNGHLEFDAEIRLRPLFRSAAPPAEVWAVDGGQAVVADARCLQLVVARAARVCFRHGTCETEEEGDLRAFLLGGAENRLVACGLGLGIAEDASVDLGLLRDHEEWTAVDRCVAEATAGALVLVDGDLEPDWRVPPSWLTGLLERAAAKGVVIAAVTKRSSLSRGGAPLLGALEIEAGAELGPRALWWAPLARTRAGARVVAARLDADAPFAFRVDLSPGTDPEAAHRRRPPRRLPRLAPPGHLVRARGAARPSRRPRGGPRASLRRPPRFDGEILMSPSQPEVARRGSCAPPGRRSRPASAVSFSAASRGRRPLAARAAGGIGGR